MTAPSTPSSRSSKRKATADTPSSARLTRSAVTKQHPPKPEPTVEIVENGVALEPKVEEVSNDDDVPERKAPARSSKKPKKSPKEPKVEEEVSDGATEGCDSLEEENGEVEHKVVKKSFAPQKKKRKDGDAAVCRFIGDPVPQSEAADRWPNRYRKKSATGSKLKVQSDDDDDEFIPAKRHYVKAEVDGLVFDLYDDVYVKADGDAPNYIGRIVEFFESPNKQQFFTAQWFYRAEDTVIGQCSGSLDPKRVFLSDVKNSNDLDCIVSKITIIQVDVGMGNTISNCDFYYDMMYSVPYTSFTSISTECKRAGSESSSTVTSEAMNDSAKEEDTSDLKATLLDLYSGCGAMSTGLCIGAHLTGLKLETAWAVDLNSNACSSLKLNHPKTEARNMNAEHYLILLKEWENLCKKYLYNDVDEPTNVDSDGEDGKSESKDASDEEFEVDRFLDITYGDPTNCGTVGLKLKVRWKGYGSDEDSWEPIENFEECQERMQEFVRRSYKTNILPCPGDVDVICGGPPCQGISGFNRFRDSKNPLQDVKNRQIIVFMDIVQHLRPKYVLMENVVDILKFSGAFLGRYAVGRLIGMNYQSRLGIMAAGCYGLPQFRGRAFLWGALCTEKLPQFPLPTHHVIVRGVIPTNFERNLVAFDENQPRDLKKALILEDAISDLPPVKNDEERDEMPYDKPPKSEFQCYIRLSKLGMLGDKKHSDYHDRLFDHRPLKLNEDDFQRVQKIPMKKGANFRDLPGVRVGLDNVVELDPTMERVYLPSKKPLVPDYALSFVGGKSTKPFGRLWWDEIVPTVVTRAEPHNQTILHPEQERVLTIRENARLQGFPDHYQLIGPIKERYIQVGNAVAVPVARALGYALGKAFQGAVTSDPLMTLPADYP